jgi:hypothetical protein
VIYAHTSLAGELHVPVSAPVPAPPAAQAYCAAGAPRREAPAGENLEQGRLATARLAHYRHFWHQCTKGGCQVGTFETNLRYHISSNFENPKICRTNFKFLKFRVSSRRLLIERVSNNLKPRGSFQA